MPAVRPYNPSGVLDVRRFGAKGDGSTDDTVAIQAAVDAVPATGGVVFFPPGTYLVPNGAIVCSKPVTIRGCGPATSSLNLSAPYFIDGVSQIKVTSATANGIVLQASRSNVEDIAIVCSHATPTAGAGILVPANIAGAGAGNGNRYRGVSVRGFYIDVDIQDGMEWFMSGCLVDDFVTHGIRIANTQEPDAGDWHVLDCLIYGGPTHINPQSGILVNSGGGGRVTANKFNYRGASGSYQDYCLELAVVDGAVTTELYVVGNGISSARNACLKIHTDGTTGSWSGITVAGNIIGSHNSNGRAIEIDPAQTASISNVAISGNVIKSFSTSLYSILVANTSGIQIAGNEYLGSQDGARLSIDSNSRKLGVAPGDLAGVGPTADQPASIVCQPGSWYFDTTLGVAQWADPNVVGTWILPRGTRRSSLSYSSSITPVANAGVWRRINVTDTNNLTVNAPTTPPDANHTQEIVFEFYNLSGGSMGTITWDSVFKVLNGSLTNPANGTKRFIKFEWNGTQWVETARAGSDYA